jgi:hypothetical protein
MEETKERRLPGLRVSHSVTSTTVNNAVARSRELNCSVQYGAFNPWPLAKIAQELTWIAPKIQNQKESGSDFKLPRRKNEEPARNNLNFDTKLT